MLAAHNLTRHIHSWDARAIYITRVAEQALRYNQLAANAMTQYTPPPWAKHADDPSYLGCFLLKRDDLVGSGVSEPSKSRNKQKAFPLHGGTVRGGVPQRRQTVCCAEWRRLHHGQWAHARALHVRHCRAHRRQRLAKAPRFGVRHDVRLARLASVRRPPGVLAVQSYCSAAAAGYSALESF